MPADAEGGDARSRRSQRSVVRRAKLLVDAGPDTRDDVRRDDITADSDPVDAEDGGIEAGTEGDIARIRDAPLTVTASPSVSENVTILPPVRRTAGAMRDSRSSMLAWDMPPSCAELRIGKSAGGRIRDRWATALCPRFAARDDAGLLVRRRLGSSLWNHPVPI